MTEKAPEEEFDWELWDRQQAEFDAKDYQLSLILFGWTCMAFGLSVGFLIAALSVGAGDVAVFAAAWTIVIAIVVWLTYKDLME
jgi:hypothetical protein